VVVQVPPVQPQFAAPLHVTVQSPAAQSVMVQVWAPWHVSWQPPPAQSIVQEPPVQSWVQSPWTHALMVQLAPLHVWLQSLSPQLIVHEPPVQVCVQSPCAQSMEHVALVHVSAQSLSAQVPLHVEPAGQVYWQSLRSPEHVSAQELLAGQTHVGSPPPVQAKPVVPPSVVTSVPDEPLHAASARAHAARQSAAKKEGRGTGLT
jgi:hypothetical protein